MYTSETSTSDTIVIETKRFQCRHIFTGGRRCRSACLTAENFCYYHSQNRKPVSRADTLARRERLSAQEAAQADFQLPDAEDRSSIQSSISQVLQRIAANQIDPRRAGLLLYGLQIASLNLRNAPAYDPEDETVDEVTLDEELGPLAPVAEFYTGGRRRNILDELLEGQGSQDFEQQCEAEAAAAGLMLQAVAAAEKHATDGRGGGGAPSGKNLHRNMFRAHHFALHSDCSPSASSPRIPKRSCGPLHERGKHDATFTPPEVLLPLGRRRGAGRGPGGRSGAGKDAAL